MVRVAERQDAYGPYPTAPIHILDAIWDYAENHNQPGGFLMSVLENDFQGAVGRADMFSLKGIKDIMLFVEWEIPAACHGSPEKVYAWLSAREITTTP